MSATIAPPRRPVIKTPLPGPKGKQIVEADAKFVNPAYPRPSFKLVAERAQGVWVEDVDGNVFLDCNAGVAVCSTGHCHPDVVRVPYPNEYRNPFNAEDCEGEGAGRGALNWIEKRLFKTTTPPEEVAGIVVEVVQGEGGYVPAPKSFLDGLRRICDEHGIMLIVDEVQSGMGRTGKMFASNHHDLRPDIVTIAKGIGSGLPIGATVARANLMNWKPGAHASTFGGNPVCIASALKTIELLENGLVQNSAEVGDYLKTGLEQ